MFFITPARALSALGALLSPCAFAGYTFEAGDVTGEATLAAGIASISARNVNFGAGRVDLRSGRNTGERAVWQEMYLKPGATLRYQISPELEVFGGAATDVLSALHWGLPAATLLLLSLSCRRIAKLAAPSEQPKS